MDAYITYYLCGFLAFNEENKLISYRLFDESERISKLSKIENLKVQNEEIDLINELSKDFDNIILETNNRKSDYSNLESFDKIQIETPNKGGEYLRENLSNVLNELNLNKEDFNDTYNKLAILKMKEASKSEDKHLIQAINSIDEIDEAISKLIERIREWYAIYFPEMDMINNNGTYIKLIAENKTKKEVISAKPDAFLLSSDEFDDDDINPEDLEIINNFANSIYSLQKSRKAIEDYIELKMESIAPNLKQLVGASLGAKLISHAGGIKRLATYPSSTVQIMGAEKALFRHLKTGERPPKYGLIYQHPQVRSSKWWVRGKVARTLASRISLAVRKDVFTGEIDENIYEDFLEKVEKIEKENPFPTKTTKRREEERNQSKNRGKHNKSKKKRRRRKRK